MSQQVQILKQRIERVGPRAAEAKWKIKALADASKSQCQTGCFIRSFYIGTEKHEHISKFLLKSDLPLVLGGTDTAPTPSEYLLSALATCVETTLLTIAKENSIELPGITECRVTAKEDLRVLLGMRFEGTALQQRRIKIKFKFDQSIKLDRYKLQELVELACRRSPVAQILNQGVDLRVLGKKRVEGGKEKEKGDTQATSIRAGELQHGQEAQFRGTSFGKQELGEQGGVGGQKGEWSQQRGGQGGEWQGSQGSFGKQQAIQGQGMQQGSEWQGGQGGQGSFGKQQGVGSGGGEWGQQTGLGAGEMQQRGYGKEQMGGVGGQSSGVGQQGYYGKESGVGGSQQMGGVSGQQMGGMSGYSGSSSGVPGGVYGKGGQEQSGMGGAPFGKEELHEGSGSGGLEGRRGGLYGKEEQLGGMKPEMRQERMGFQQ